MRWAVFTFAAIAVMSAAGAGLAADPQGSSGGAGGVAAEGARRQVTAEDLFRQGVELIEKGQWAEAAVKLEESNRQERAAGTTVNLADCYEHIGKLASAWSLFEEAAAAFGRRTPPDPRGDIAKSRATALYPRLSRLTVDVPEAVRATRGLVVKRDGEEIGAAQFGTGIAVDPGAHVIEASAPGKRAWKAEVKVGGEAAKAAITVPVLEDAPMVAPVPTGSGAAEWGGRHTGGVIAAGLGIVGIAVGAGLGADAAGKHSDSKAACPSRVGCSAEAIDLENGAKGSATGSTIAFIAGGVAVAGGAVLFLTAGWPFGAKAQESGGEKKAGARAVTVRASARGAMVTIEGGF